MSIQSERTSLLTPSQERNPYSSFIEPFLSYQALNDIQYRLPLERYPCRFGGDSCLTDVAMGSSFLILLGLGAGMVSVYGSCFSLCSLSGCGCVNSSYISAAAVSGAGLTSAGGCGLGLLSARVYYKNKLAVSDFRNRITQILEGEGNLTARVRNEHIRELLPHFSPEQYRCLDFPQARVCYEDLRLREIFIRNIDHLKPVVNRLFQLVNEIHQMAPHEFIVRWNNEWWRETTPFNPDLNDLIGDCLPHQLQENEQVGEAIRNNPLPREPLRIRTSVAASSSQMPETIRPFQMTENVLEENTSGSYVEFTVNQRSFAFKKSTLMASSNYFSNILADDKMPQRELGLGTAAFQITLDIPAEDLNDFEMLMRLIAREINRVPVDHFKTIIEAAQKYDLFTFLREHFINNSDDYPLDVLLELSLRLNIESLKTDMISVITQKISITSMENYGREILSSRLVEIYTILDRSNLFALKKALKEKYIECFKYLIDHFKENKIEPHFQETLQRLDEYMKAIRPTIDVLSTIEIKTLWQALQSGIDKYIYSTKSLKEFMQAVMQMERGILKDAILVRLQQEQNIVLLKGTFGREMPKDLYRLLRPSK